MVVKESESAKIRAYLGKNISDGVVSRVYSEYIVNGLNISIDNYLINLKEYKLRIHGIYERYIKEYLGPDSKYLKKTDYVTKLVPHPIEENAIHEYVLSLEELRIERGKINDTSLSKDAREKIEDELKKRCVTLSEYDMRNAIISVTDLNKCINLYLDSLDTFCREELSRWIDIMFKNIYGRNISIPEYVNYYKSMLGCKNIDEVEMIMRDKYKQFLSGYSIGKTIHMEYLDYEIDDENFGRIFIDQICNDDWDSVLKKNIIDGKYEFERYRKCVSDALRAIYKSMWNEDTEDYNIEHMFIIAKSKEYSGCSHGLDEIVVFVEDATKKYNISINNIYNRILKRLPDVNEVCEGLKLYRTYENSEENNSEKNLEDILYDSIEYIDVLKSIICEVHHDKNVVILPSNLYRILKDILELENGKLKRDETAMKEYISTQLR